MSTAPGVTADHPRACSVGGTMSAVPGQSLVQRVVRLAVSVFRSPGGPSSHQQFREGLANLSQMTHQLTAQDVGFDLSWVRDRRPYDQSQGVMPMTYVRLFENDAVSIGIFILKNGFTLPTHDHPKMYGVLKVLHGSLLMQSFSRVSTAPGAILDQGGGGSCGSSSSGGASSGGGGDWDVRQTRLGLIYHTQKEAARRLTPTDAPCVLTPEQNNIHQIQAVDGPVAFLDILAPPYDDCEHVYHNFRELEPDVLCQLTGGAVAAEGWLLRVRNSSFYSDSAPYGGPPLDDIR